VSKYGEFLKNPTVRLAGRALVAALGAGFALEQAAGWSSSQDVLKALGVGMFLAFAEVFTPLNKLVGLFKGDPQ
jgi:hypothetical protein